MLAAGSFASRFLSRAADTNWHGRYWKGEATKTGFIRSFRFSLTFAAGTVLSKLNPYLGSSASVEPTQSTASTSTEVGKGLRSRPVRSSHSLSIVYHSSFFFLNKLLVCNRILELVSPRLNTSLVSLTISSIPSPPPLLGVLELPHHRSGFFIGDPL